MKTYKMLSATRMKIAGNPIPDMTVVFSSEMTLAEIHKALREIVDGHVMAETVNLESKYTGERQ